MFPLVLSTPPPHLRQCIALFAVAERRLLLDIGWFVLFFLDKFKYTFWYLNDTCTTDNHEFTKHFYNIYPTERQGNNENTSEKLSQFNFTYRYIDDVLSINNPDFDNYLGQMYPA